MPPPPPGGIRACKQASERWHTHALGSMLLFIGGIYLKTNCITLTASGVVRETHHATRHSTPIHNVLSTDHQLSTSQKALGTLPVDGNVIPKHVGTTIHN
jgi:hypothetical protein